uniref:Protein Ycf2 n=1 Tax=Dioon spinulosum TaxID=115877 RepID=A0A0A6Z8P3_DIOSP|nr:hypothetical protein [Dioon spinulosum]YP_009158492.1 hypothetical protein [Dioon spinulosum]AFS64418.1 hypothetical protein [Dioon spinulosum]AFS64485.1 hypothetical protein [Dioon spinulosum]BAR93679.1 hypothetical protein [Dioon spinulosum]BAR93698.1 hypothetical protein [Dioon spinulosum]BDI62879.1 hypothetical protein RF2 [Dioon spinulosum]
MKRQKLKSWILKLEEIRSFQCLLNSWTELNLVRLFTKIVSHRERLIKLFDSRILSTLLLRDLRGSRSNQSLTIKGVVLLTLPVLVYHVNNKSMIERKKFYSMKLFPMPINYVEPRNETSEEDFESFNKNLLIFPHLSLSFPKGRKIYQSHLINLKEDAWVPSKRRVCVMPAYNQIDSWGSRWWKNWIIEEILPSWKIPQESIAKIEMSLKERDVGYLKGFFEFYIDDLIRKDYDWEYHFDRVFMKNKQDTIDLSSKQQAEIFGNNLICYLMSAFCEKMLFEVEGPFKQHKSKSAIESNNIEHFSHPRLSYQERFKWGPRWWKKKMFQIWNSWGESDQILAESSILLKEKGYLSFQNYAEFYIWQFYKDSFVSWEKDQQKLDLSKDILKDKFIQLNDANNDQLFSKVQNLLSDILYDFSESIFIKVNHSSQLKRSYNRSIDHFDPISENSEYDTNISKKDERISENQRPITWETHSEKDEKDIDSKIDSALNFTENEYWELEKDLYERIFTNGYINKTEIEQLKERSILWDPSSIRIERTKIESDLPSRRLSEDSPISWTKELFTEDKKSITDNLFPKERKRFIENFTKSIRSSFFDILSIDEPCMGSSATKKPIENFQLLRRQQDVFFRYFRGSEKNGIVDPWKIRTYFQNPSSNCAISLDPGFHMIRKDQRDINRLNRILFMNRSLSRDRFSSFCDQDKEQYILHSNFRLKKRVLKITEKFALSITKPNQVYDNTFAPDIDYHVNQFYELNKNILLNQIFNHKKKLKNQSLLILLNITDKENEYLDRIIEKELIQIYSKKSSEIGTPLNNYRTETSNWYKLIRHKIHRHLENAFNKFYSMNGSSRNLKDQIRTNWIENESLNNVTKDTINRHPSNWRKGQKEWFDHSILRTEKCINRNLNVYKWSNQTEYLKKCSKHLVSKQNDLKRVFDPIESCTNRDSIGWSGSPNKKYYSKFSFISENTVKIFISKFDISISHSDILIPKVLIDRLKSMNDQLFNKLFKSIGVQIVHLKTFKPFLLYDHNLSQRSKFLIDERTVAQSFYHEIPVNRFIIDLFDNEKNCMELFDNTDFSTISNDRDNWLNPVKLSNKSSSRASFYKANTLQFFDYSHHPRFNYKKRLPSYMERIHTKDHNLTYGQLFNISPIHSNLFSLPISEIRPVHLDKDTISLIKSQVSNIFLPKDLQQSGNQTLVSIYDLYKSFDLLTRLNPFVHDKIDISSIEEISTTPLTRERIVNFEKTYCQPLLNRSDLEENNFDQYLKRGFSSNMGLIQTQSYQDDLLSEIFIKRKENNQEMLHRIRDWFVKSSSTEGSKNRIENKAIDKRSTLLNFSKEERNLFSFCSPRFNERAKKQEMYRISQIESLFKKWDLFRTYTPWFLTSAWWKYLENLLLETFPEILLNSSDQLVSILHDIMHKSNLSWAISHQLWALLQCNLRTNILDKLFYLWNLCSFKEMINQKNESSVLFIWAHLRLLNAREFEYSILILFFVLGYFVLRYSFVVSSALIELQIHLERIKDLMDPSYAIELQKLMDHPLPGLLFSMDIRDISIYFLDELIYSMRNRKLYSPIRRELNRSCFSMDISGKERELLVQFLITQKNISQFGSNLTHSHNLFKNEFDYQITEQPGLIYLIYLADTYQKDLMNHEFDQSRLAERWVFLAFCRKITSSQISRGLNLTFHGKPFSLHLGSSLSKGILLIGPTETGRSYLVKGLAADSYVPLIRISLNKFLYDKGEYSNFLDIRSMNNVVQKMHQFNLTFELAKRMSPCIIWIPNIHELNVNYLTHFFLGLLVNHLSRDDEKDSTRNILVIASTHIPKKVDPAPIAPNRLDRSINIRMLPIPQRQKEFPILLRSKGFDSEKGLSCPNEFGSRTIGSNARDLAALANEALSIGITQKKSVIDTDTIRLALYRQTWGLQSMDNQVGSGQNYEILPYKVGKAVIQNTLRRNSSMNPLSINNELWKKRFYYLSKWYLEPSIAGTTMKELTILPHILGCLAGSAARDSWFISEQNRENWIPLDRFAEHDFDLASGLLESLLVEFPWLGICRGKSDKNQITFAPQSETRNHLNMMRKGVSSMVNKMFIYKEYGLKFQQETPDARQMDEKLVNNIVWAPRIWRLSFLRSNLFDRTKRPNELGFSYQFGLFQEEQISYCKRVRENLGSLQKGPHKKGFYVHERNHSNARQKNLQHIQSQLEDISLQERFEMLGVFQFSIQYQMRSKSSKKPMFFLGRRFLWDPTGFLFQDQHLVFSRREFFANEEMLKRLYITYGSIRRQEKHLFPKKSIQGAFRRYNSKFMTNSAMNSWKQLPLAEKEHIEAFKRIQAIGIRLKRIQPYTPTFLYQRWLIENPQEKVDRFELLIHRQRWLETNSSLSNESFLYNTLSESYQYLSNLFLSNRMLLNQMTRTLLKNRWLFPKEIEHLIHTTKDRFHISILAGRICHHR